jgi:hypothetical protein
VLLLSLVDFDEEPVRCRLAEFPQRALDRAEGGVGRSAPRISSKPTMLSRLGTSMLWCWASRRRPSASRSL